MNLKEVRIKFRDISGRYDLVNDDFSDNGADFFINEASKRLDRISDTTKSWATHNVIIAPGTWYVQFQNARAIKEVWATTAEGKVQLTKKRMQDLIAEFWILVPAEWTNGTPEYFSPFLSRYNPEDISAVTLATFTPFIGVIPKANHEYNALILSCPVELQTLIEIYGLFYSFKLTLDTDENFWTQVHPMTLVQEAIRQTYLTSGNRVMSKSYKEGVDEDIIEINKDLVEQEIAELDQMEG